VNDRPAPLVVFDLDGTLVDSADTIYQTIRESLRRMNVSANITPETIRPFIGAHFKDIFAALRVDVDADEFLAVYKNLYFDYIDSSSLYPDALETLDRLREAGYKTALLTTKMQSQADRIAELFGLDKRLDYTLGRREGLPLKPDPAPLRLIVRELGASMERTAMCGDTEYDVGCAQNAGAYALAASYGFRTRDELLRLNPDRVYDRLAELPAILAARFA
jgi:phosphoglycolate phosphatase-like HAD superfamily hydrolase